MKQTHHSSEPRPEKGLEGARKASIFRVTLFGGLINSSKTVCFTHTNSPRLMPGAFFVR